MVRDPLLASLRAWLVFLSLFELPEIHGFLLGDKSLADGFGSGLRDGGAERRLWSAFLACLVLARVAAACDARSPTVAVHNAAVHALECGGLRAAVINAVVAATEKSKELGAAKAAGAGANGGKKRARS